MVFYVRQNQTRFLCLSDMSPFHSMVAGHWSLDSRGALPLFDKFFEFLISDISDTPSHALEELQWGKETERLAPAATQALKQRDTSIIDESTILAGDIEAEAKDPGKGPQNDDTSPVSVSYLDLR